MHKLDWALATAGAVMALTVQAAPGPKLGDLLANSGIKATGDVAASYTAGFNEGQKLNYRPFDSNSNSVRFNQAILTVGKLPTDGFGGRVRVIAGSDAQGVNKAYGSGSSDLALHVGYLRYAHDGFDIIGGRYITLAGPERIVASVNANLSRSLLFTLAQPRVETGVRASYALNPVVRVYLGLSNDERTPPLKALAGRATAGVASDSNKQKVLETGIALAASPQLRGAVRDYYSHQDGIGFNYLDLVARYAPAPRWRLMFNADWFHAHTPGGAADLYGGAAYITYRIAPQWSTTLRGEVLRTKDIILAGGAPKRTTFGEATTTLAYAPAVNFTLLAELRYDLGDHDQGAIVNGNGRPREAVGNVGIEAIYHF